MESICGSTLPFGPFDNGRVTVCFLDTAVHPVLMVVFVAAAARRLYLLRRLPPSPPLPRSKVHILRLIGCVLLSLLPLVWLGVHGIDGGAPTALMVTPAMTTVAYLVATILCMVERAHGVRATWVLRTWWLLDFVVRSLRVQTSLDSRTSVNEADTILQCFMFAVASVLCLLGLYFNRTTPEGSSGEDGAYARIATDDNIASGSVAPSSPRARARKRLDEELAKERSPFERANLISRLLFSYMNPLLAFGYRSTLEQSDMYPLAEADLCEGVHVKFDHAWRQQLRKRDTGGTPSLPRALVRTFGRSFALAGLFKMCQDVLMFAGPQLLKEIVIFIKKRETVSIYFGLFLVLLLLSASVAQSIFVHQYFFRVFRISFRARAALVAAVYKKSFVLSNMARKESTVGEIVTLQSVDASKVMDLLPYLHMVWSAPLQLFIGIGMLFTLIGWASLGAVAVMILLIPLNSKVAKLQSKYQKSVMELTDKRVRATTEMLNGIRLIKFFAWRKPFEEKITAIRTEELNGLKKLGYLRCITIFFWTSSPIVVAVCTFAMYTFLDNELSAEVAFATLALLNILRFPLQVFPMIISSLVEARVSVKRIQKYMLSEELDTSVVIEERTDAVKKSTVVEMKKASFTWDESSSQEPTLQDISFRVKRGQLVVIVGEVGAGKSTLFSALLGEVPKVSGTVHLLGSCAYVPQQAWLQNATLRDNILFGTAYDKERYERVVRICELTADIAMLPKGDETEIGEKGINLSGGQKQRVSLARAVYQNAELYLLDDPLSAVDAHVGKAIFENCIANELRDKTVILATHQLQVVKNADFVLTMQNGRIAERGTYAELMADESSTFASLIRKHVKEARSDAQADDDGQATAEGGAAADDGAGADAKKEKEGDGDDEKKSKEKSKDDVAGGTIISKEESATGSVRAHVYLTYMRSLGGVIFLVLLIGGFIADTLTSIGSNLWLSVWADASQAAVDARHMNMSDVDAALDSMTEFDATAAATTNEYEGDYYYLGLYALIGVANAVAVFERALVMMFGSLRASSLVHHRMLRCILLAPVRFFDTTPIGRVLNRFSKDINVIDQSLSRVVNMLLRMIFWCFGIMIVICGATPMFAVALLPLSYVYRYAQRYYLMSSREVQRLDSTTKSPIYAQFQETLTGVSTIRAYRRVDAFTLRNNERLNTNQRAYFVKFTANRWLGLRLELVGAGIVTIAALFAVLERGSISGGLAGLSIAYALQLTGTLNWLVRMSSDVETQLVSVERVIEYSELEPEAPPIVENNRPDERWPRKGRIDIRNLSVRYRAGLDLVLKNVSCTIEARQKVGVVGRTGAGKSSLMLALFRFMEASEGSIVIDDVDISTIGVEDLRSRLSIIPQDPTLFSMSVRKNLDPFEQSDDASIWAALESVQMKEAIAALDGKLDADVVEGGENFSVGQRQLLCLARAILRKARILVLDEATASVDFECDSLIQETIRKAFKKVTVLTIAHRIHTIVDYDRIMVLDSGRIAEFDTPANLLNNPKSEFYKLVHESGTTETQVEQAVEEAAHRNAEEAADDDV